MLKLLLLLLPPWGACASSPPSEVKCYIVNLDYVNCTWYQPTAPAINYTFFANFEGGKPKECPWYLLGAEGVSVGCRFPYTEAQRFTTFHTSLRAPGQDPVYRSHDVKNTVKMSPPSGLRLQWEGQTLSLTWQVRAGFKRRFCIQSQVQYCLNDKCQRPTKLVPGEMRYSVMFPSNSSQHKFRVQVRIDEPCAFSDWGEWSPLVVWGNRTDTTRAPPTVTWMSLTLYVCLAAVLLILLSCLLVHSERLRITLIPVVPRPGKNLTELIDTYNGNVEKWLCISKELQEGFRPTFQERPCAVREYRLLAQGSVESDSGVSLSDSSSLSSCSSTSTSSLPCSSDCSPAGSY